MQRKGTVYWQMADILDTANRAHAFAAQGKASDAARHMIFAFNMTSHLCLLAPEVGRICGQFLRSADIKLIRRNVAR